MIHRISYLKENFFKNFPLISPKRTASVINDIKTISTILETDISSILDTNLIKMKQYFEKITLLDTILMTI